MKKLCSMCKRKAVDYKEQYCDDCKPKAEAMKEVRWANIATNKGYKEKANKTKADRHKNDREQKFYHSMEWQRLRAYMLGYYKGYCIYCLLKENKLSEAKDVHHIVTLKDDWDKRADKNNLICLCRDCHLYIHEQYERSPRYKREMISLLKALLDKWTVLNGQIKCTLNIEEVS